MSDKIFDEHLLEAKGWLLIGMTKQASEKIAGRTDLGAHIVAAQIDVEKDAFRAARSRLEDALDSAQKSDPLYAEALWTLALIYAKQERIRPSLSLLDDLDELKSSWRLFERQALRSGLNALKKI